MKKIVIGLSGGMDSATLLGGLLNEGYEVYCCSFLYGSKHSKYEMSAAKKIIEYYKEYDLPVFHYIFDLRQVFEKFDSALLTNTNEKIPEGYYNDDNMKRTVVPGRNLILASVMAGFAESIGAEAIALGVHAGDHHIYPDCRPEFINDLRFTINHSTEYKVNVLSPLLFENKKTILEIGLKLTPQVPYEFTRTCYKDQELSCGKCGSCVERLEAFGMLNLKDPIIYE